MKKYNVYIPISGYLSLETEAEDEESAIKKAFASEDQLTLDNIAEWRVHKLLVQGNCCSATLWEAEAEEINN